MGLPPHYEQTRLSDMNTRMVGDAVVRDVIGPTGATDAHVSARLTSSILPAGGTATLELPQPGEELFLYFVDGNGRFQTSTAQHQIDLYDVVLAKPAAETAVMTAGPNKPLNYLSFYLRPFM